MIRPSPRRRRPRRRTRPRLQNAGTTIAFCCPVCDRAYGDAAYHGPAPHAPASLCLDCWADQWANIETCIFRDYDWSVMDQAIWLLCQGFSHAEAALLIGRHRNSLTRWLLRLRKFPHLIPEWLSKRFS